MRATFGASFPALLVQDAVTQFPCLGVVHPELADGAGRVQQCWARMADVKLEPESREFAVDDDALLPALPHDADCTFA